MSTITRERVAEFIKHPLDNGLTRGEQMELARIALASLEAEASSEPVAFINGAWTLVYYRPPKELGLKIGDKLYTAPPAPVSVPDALDDYVNSDDHPLLWSHNKGWNACRAAMLQGADGNSLVVPDGWVACSERMPEEDGNYWGWWSESKRQGQVWFIKSELQAQFQSSEITHWMPLPAAPQQEA